MNSSRWRGPVATIGTCSSRRARLLFVAHRAEILTQTLALFRHALRDHGFGELWVQGERPDRFEHVFASIQSLHANGLDALAADHFDVVIVDEFHHAAADSYRALLERVAPRELLGLTATPERSDGSSVLDWFDGRIAAELRLWDAIDRQFLVPFAYYGIHDGLDLREIPWKRGRGYDIDGLTQLYTGNDAWARFVVKEVAAHVDDCRSMRALGFCVSVDHARFMARVFTEAGIPAVAIWANTPADERRQALRDLATRKINAVFSVDLFNEGVDVPAVDTLLFLRPTESATLFLQQLGRGLRRSTKKTVCTVLDFVGQHRAEFRFDRKLRALLGGSRKDLETQIEAQFPYLPAGCHMELDRKASEIILKSVRGAIPKGWATKTEELRTLSRGGDVTLAGYLAEAGLDLEDLYAGDKAWSDLREAAGLPTLAKGPYETVLRRACGRLLHLDDRPRLARYGELLADDAPPVEALPVRDQRYLRMLAASLLEKAVTKTATLGEGAALLKEHPQVRAELRELFSLLSDAVTHVGSPFPAMPNVPLTIHGRYTRAEIIAAFGDGEGAKVARWQKGIRWFPEHKTDLLAFTLDKTVGQFSPTTRYRDYAISRTLIHWESQSVTREASETGRRYQEHEARGSTVLLFARLRSDERAFYFLGPASYVSHEGEMPMAITWRLHHPLPADLFATFAAAVA